MEKKCEWIIGGGGGGGWGAKDMLAPFQNYWGTLPPLPPPFLRLC